MTKKKDKPNKSRTGPKTLSGKTAVSGNAITHGITSTRLTSSEQKQAYQHFLTELTAHYQPQSPLEVIQIERIAMLRTKLRHLYEVETLKMELAERATHNDLQAIFSHMPHITGITRGMLTELLRHDELVLPCGLQHDQLIAIFIEINSLSVDLDSEEDIRQYLPQLSSYLETIELDIEQSKNTLSRRLIAVNESLKTTIAEGENYNEYVKRLIKYREKPDSDTEHDEHYQEVLNYVQQRQEEHAARQKKASGARSKMIAQNEFPNAQAIHAALENFKLITIAYINAVDHLEEAMHIRDLKVRSVTLDGEQMDRFMRYQTTLERRLSALIGELILMQERRETKLTKNPSKKV